MFPPQDPPPLKDSDLAPLLTYGLCGALVGIGIAGLAVTIEYAFRWEEWKHRQIVGEVAIGRWRLTEPELDVRDVIGWTAGITCGGIFAGFFLAVVVAIWSPARLPIRAAALCASFGGTCVLLTMAAHLIDQREDSRAFIRTIVAIGVITFLCGLFGYIHALLVRRAMLLLERWRNRNDVASG